MERWDVTATINLTVEVEDAADAEDIQREVLEELSGFEAGSFRGRIFVADVLKVKKPQRITKERRRLRRGGEVE